MPHDISGRNPIVRVLSLKDFRLLFAGASLSLLGDQFALIATPWLVLRLTGDPMVLGIVLALAGLPRAVFMLVGGVVTDRLSPRRIMLIADSVRLGLTVAMVSVVLSGAVEVWMVYIFSLAFGIVAGFAVPAENAIVPTLLGDNDLQAGNSLMMGVAQLAGFAGPSLAGIVIGVFTNSLTGVAWAYGIDAASFAISALCLFLIRDTRVKGQGDDVPKGVFAPIRAAFDHVWQDDALRLVFVVLAAINFLLIGPLTVGIPILADTRLAEGAVAFGMLMSAFSAGSLCGYAAAGALPRPSSAVVRVILIAMLFAFSLVVGLFGFVPLTIIDVTLMTLLGLGDGYLSIMLFTWIQHRTPKQMLGRIMSFVMFANSGLVPLSQALSGALGKWNLDAMFVIAGSLNLLVAIWAMTRPELSLFSDSLAAKPAPEEQGV